MGKTTPEISVVLPAHNEADNIAPMCAALKRVLAPLGSYEIIFVDDGSGDETLNALRAAASADGHVRYLSFTRNFGHQAALRAGLRNAHGNAVVVMDADFEHPPELIRDMATLWRAGSVIVGAQRIDDAKIGFIKRWTSSLYYRALDAIGDIRIAAGSADFMLLDRVVVDAVNALDDQDLFLRGIVRWFGYPVAQLPFKRGERRAGESKFTMRRMIELAVSGIAGHSLRPLRLAIYLALGFAGIGMVFVVYSVISFYFVQHTVAGWTSIMAAIAILGAAQLLVLGVFGEYLGRLLREARKRPHYVIGETEADRRKPAGKSRVTKKRAAGRR